MDEKVQHRVGVRFGSVEHVLPKNLGGVKPFESIWVRITDGLEQSSPKVRYLVFGRNPEERREGGKIRGFASVLKSGSAIMNGGRFDFKMEPTLGGRRASRELQNQLVSLRT